MTTIFPPALVRRLNKEYNFEESPHFDDDSPGNEALIIVDMQYDFLPGGALAVPQGDEIIAAINNFQEQYDLVVATQDWHPADHLSFASNHENKKPMETIDLNGQPQVLWPDHCIQGSRGARLTSDLNTNRIEMIVRKGMDRTIDSYSAFFDNGHKKSTGLAGFLMEKAIHKIAVCGLAADFCVYYTAMDALDLGFEVEILLNGTKPIDSEEFKKKLKHFEEKGGTVRSH